MVKLSDTFWRPFIIKKSFFKLLIFFSLIFLDQAVKFWVTKKLVKSSSKILLIKDFLSITYKKNIGIAFGLFSDLNKYVIIIFILFIIFLFVLFILKTNIASYSKNSFVLILAGTVSNLLDRLVRNFVVDYIEVLFFPYIFNLADVYIVFGFSLLAYFFIFKNKRVQKN